VSHSGITHWGSFPQAAFEEHQRSMAAVQSEKPRIVRNAGAGGSRDIHLQNFSVSNGGAELLEDADLLLAYGRRYGLIGRNGTGWPPTACKC
jgi:ATP-binding cassette subfamily F protein 3